MTPATPLAPADDAVRAVAQILANRFALSDLGAVTAAQLTLADLRERGFEVVATGGDETRYRNSDNGTLSVGCEADGVATLPDLAVWQVWEGCHLRMRIAEIRHDGMMCVGLEPDWPIRLISRDDFLSWAHRTGARPG